METFEAIQKRASLKNRLSGREVEREKIEQVLQAARLAPSAMNKQPWRFIVVEGRENVDRVVSRAFGEGNQVIKKAPVLIIACANPGDDVIADGKEFYLLDLGMAFENLLLAGTNLGLVTHPMAHVYEDELRKVLGIPPEFKFVLATPLAYPAEGSYDEAAKDKLNERTRKNNTEIFYGNAWGQPY
ncbi:nitroreductase family protein [Chloroflexota bacterium]